MGVVFVHEPSSAAPGDPGASTRARVLQVITQEGPISAAEVAGRLDLTPAGVRRHLDHLIEAGSIAVHDHSVSVRGRGRPAKAYVVAERGHDALGGDYDELASDALRYLADTLGPSAVDAFAEGRVARIEQRYRPEVEAAGESPVARAEALVAALRRDGYAASARPARSGVGLQLCQGHCPVQQVATEFPQFCDAETEAFGRLLGVHVQRLATLAHGNHVCTTFIPAATLHRAPAGAAPATETPPPTTTAPSTTERSSR